MALYMIGFKNKIVHSLSAFLICITSLSVLAISDDMTFSPLLTDIAPGEIQTFFQDDSGFMWIGGRNSLLRYNAYEYQEILIQEGDKPPQVSPQYTTQIFQESSGRIWVTSHSGLFWFDADREVLIRAAPETGLPEPVYAENVHSINQLSSGQLLIGLNNGFAVVNSQTLVPYRTNLSAYGRDAETAAIYDILVDDEDFVWLGGRTGIYSFDVNSGKTEHFIPDPDNPDSQVDNALWSIAMDDSGKIWGGTLGAGLYVFDPATKLFTRFRAGATDSKGLKEDAIWGIMKDSQGNMWVGHDRSGFSIFDFEKDSFVNYNYTPGTPGALIYNAVRTFYEDNNHDIWIGHYPGGISFHDSSSAAIKVYRPNYENPDAIRNQNVQGLGEDKKGNLWVAVGDGVDYFDRSQGVFKHYRKDNGKYPAHGTLSGYLDSKGIMWVGTWTEGYHRYNPEKDLFESMPTEPQLAGNLEQSNNILDDATIWSFCERRDGSFWIGTHYAGINRMPEGTGEIKKYINNNTDKSISNNIAWACFEDSKGRFWVGTAWGLSLFNDDDGSFRSYRPQEGIANQLQSGSITSIYEDAQARIWIGTNSGLYLYREDRNNFQRFATETGMNNHGIKAVTGDGEGMLWLGTESGISVFDPNTFTAKNYLEHAGIKFSGINTGAAITTHKGEVVFGSVDGLIVIDVNKLTINKNPPPIALTDFKVFAKSVEVGGEDGLLKSVIDQTDAIVLDHTKKMFSFEFAALNFRYAYKNQYAYMLEGFDREWREIGTERKAQYTNLGSGNYVFRVKATNNDGVWNEKGASIKIRQLPPPWLTWWAYLIYVFILCGIVLQFIASQKRKRRVVEEQNKLLEMKVAERTKDLAEKNKDIQAMLSNMRQGLFTIEESGEIHHEYSDYLESIFETKNVAGRSAVDLLFEHAKLDADIIDQIEVSLFSIIGMDEMNYEFNSHLLIREFRTEINGKPKILSLDWNPIMEDVIVTSVMVSVRDVTALKALELEAAGKKRELEIVEQLLNVSAKKYHNFYSSAQRYLEECQVVIDEHEDYSEDAVASLFRNMHTIKGNSRTQGFTHIAAVAHNVESLYSDLKSNPKLWDRGLMKSDLEQLSSTLQEYDSVYRNVLKRDEGGDREEDGVWFNKESLSVIQQGVDKLKNYDQAAFNSVYNVIERSMASPMAEVIASNIKSLPSIAQDLDKEPPSVALQDNDIYVRESIHNLLSDVFSHLLRNSLDHGIESIEERQENNKDSQGHIDISLDQAGEYVEIAVKDDGRGLDLQRLYAKGIEIGKWSEGQSVSVTQLADLIFASGVSTKETVSDISGRGVGMDAVKQFLVQSGGDIELQVDDASVSYESSSGALSMPFATVIRLPKSFFVTSE